MSSKFPNRRQQQRGRTMLPCFSAVTYLLNTIDIRVVYGVLSHKNWIATETRWFGYRLYSRYASFRKRTQSLPQDYRPERSRVFRGRNEKDDSRFKDGLSPIEVVTENTGKLEIHRIQYHGGSQIPHLERAKDIPDYLDEILKPLTATN